LRPIKPIFSDMIYKPLERTWLYSRRAAPGQVDLVASAFIWRAALRGLIFDEIPRVEGDWS
jgi:hypothetical protein